ncbi:MAG: hypothetical protein HQ495_15390 [Alphaproteobacteria bacterium]|nr:hypothetical protein [Alphaproteobacteria bacterium]
MAAGLAFFFATDFLAADFFATDFLAADFFATGLFAAFFLALLRGLAVAFAADLPAGRIRMLPKLSIVPS